MKKANVPRFVENFVPLKNKMYADPAYIEILERIGLTDFESVMAFEDGEIYKKNRYRCVMRIPCAHGKALFLKKHFAPAVKETYKAWCAFTRPKSSARLEVEAIRSLEQIGVRSMKPVAVGEAHRRLYEPRSFLITEELTAERLEEFLPRCFNDPTFSRQSRLILIEKVAQLSRSMHDAGIHHRDFYLGHILITPRTMDLWVIDVQRVRRLTHLARRWRVKDISQLLYTTPDVVTASEKLRFFKTYIGHTLLSRNDRRFIKQVVAKTGRIAQHVIKKRARKKRRRRHR